MKQTLAFWLAIVLVLGFGFTITPYVLLGGYGITSVSPTSAGIGAFSITLSSFAYPVLLQFEWWVTLGMLAVAFRVAYQAQTSSQPSL